MKQLRIYLAVGSQSTEAAVDFADMAAFSSTLDDCLARLSRAAEFRRPTGLRPRLVIRSVELGSYSTLLEPVDSVSEKTIGLLPSVLHSIRRGTMPPGLRLTGEDLRAFRHLSDPVKSHTGMIRIEDCTIDHAFEDGINKLLAESPRSFGEIIGILDGLNVHRRNTCRVYPETQSHGAECFFEEELYPLVHGAMRQRVRVSGFVRRDPDGVTVDSVDVQRIEPLPSDVDLPDPLTLRGLLSGGPTLAEIREGWNA